MDFYDMALEMNKYTPEADDWQNATLKDLVGFTVDAAFPAIGPEGVTLLYGHYAGLDRLTYVIGLMWDDDEGKTLYQKALCRFPVNFEEVNSWKNMIPEKSTKKYEI